MYRSTMRLIFFMMAGAIFNLAGAAQHTLTLPAETAQFKTSTLPGYLLATQRCMTCHSADYIKYQPPGMSLLQWTAEVKKMKNVYGAPLSDDEVEKIGAYLAVTYGNTQKSDLPANLTTASTVTTPSPDSTNASKLLATNTCLACHAIDKKIVGPAYRDVAQKYRGDRLAIDKIEASIRLGGAGKWGSIAMPAFPQLKPEELRLLAEFILKQ